MEKTILIAGKNMPDVRSFTDGVSISGRNIVVTGAQTDAEESSKKLTVAERKSNQAAYEEEKSREAKSGLCTIEWNKSSPLSARSLVLQTLTIFGELDEAVLFFDEEWFASKAEQMDTEEISRCCDEMIAGYEFLALEILSTFKKRGDKKGTLIFLLKTTPSRIDVVNFPSLNNGLRPIASPLVSAGAAAFASFAENLAAICDESSGAEIILVKDSSTSEGGFLRDDEVGKWLCGFLNSRQNEIFRGEKKSVRWIKACEKNQPAEIPHTNSGGGFHLFGRRKKRDE
jgi:hypothetical protein